jgi:hypothetical protein
MSPTPDRQKRRTQIAVLFSTAAVFVSLAASGLLLVQRFSETNSNRRDIRHTWHAVICSIEQQELRSKVLTPQQKQQTLRFFDGILIHNVGAQPCGLHVEHPRR